MNETPIEQLEKSLTDQRRQMKHAPTLTRVQVNNYERGYNQLWEMKYAAAKPTAGNPAETSKK